MANWNFYKGSRRLRPDNSWLFLCILSGCHKVTPHPLRHRSGCHVEPPPTPMSSLFLEHVCTVGQTLPRGNHVIMTHFIYSTSTLKPDTRWLILCMWFPWSNLPFTSMSLLCIVRILLRQTIDDSSYVYVVALSNPPTLSHRYL